MNILDTNGLSHIFTNRVIVQDKYYLAPDVAEEVEMTQLVHGRRVPKNVLEIAQDGSFNEAIYLERYNQILNKYGGRSFYNMTGFGDVSILATLHMLFDAPKAQVQGELFAGSNQPVVYTDDVSLTDKINNEFPNGEVIVYPVKRIQ